MSTLWKVLTRKKVIDPDRTEETSLARVLNTFDLTALGVGSTLGVGMYVLVGKVARETAGPSVVISFLIAAIASAFAGLCYAEFGARAPRAGSAYVYSYVCVGEFIAFVIGWNLILEYIIGSASVARGMSLYIDALLNDTLKNTFLDLFPIGINFLSPYFDFLSFTIAIILSIGLAFGMKESSKINNIFTILNILVVLFVVIAGSTKADPKNWSLEVPANVTDGGSGGFLPFGVGGMIKGAATCFYGFVGFDCIATTGEEVKNPQRAIPFAIILSLGIVFVAYFSTATVVTLMVPYYLQDVNSPIPHAFDEFGWEAAKWIVTIGGIFALCASLFGAMFPLPRIIYAMASDGLVFKFLGKVSERFLTPVTGTLLAGLLTGIMAAIFEQGQLVDMMSIGTLLAYTIVAACVLLLRYSVDEEQYSLVRTDSDSSVASYADHSRSNLVNEDRDYSVLDEESFNNVTFTGLVKQFFNGKKSGKPTKVSERLVNILVCFYCLLCLLLGLCAIYLIEEISRGVIYAIALPSVCGLLMIITLMSITVQPNSKQTLTFKVPLVPLIPAISILVNIYLMLSLDVTTWIRFGVWMGIGLPIYFYSACSYKKDTLAFKEVGNKEAGKNSFTNLSYVHDETKGSVNSDSAYLSDENKTNDGSAKNDSVSSATLKKMIPPLPPKRINDFHNAIDRKVSIAESIANCHVEENVVAIIHREDEPIVEARNFSRVNSEEECLAVMSEFDEMVEIEQQKLDVPEAANTLIIENAKCVEVAENNSLVMGDDKFVRNDDNNNEEFELENDLYGSVRDKKDSVNGIILEENICQETVENAAVDENVLYNNNEEFLENDLYASLGDKKDSEIENIILEENISKEGVEHATVVEGKTTEENKAIEETPNLDNSNILISLDNENLSNSSEIILPPPPPPMEAFETFKSKIPRVPSFLKRKKSPRIPPPDYDVVPEVQDVDDHMEFGSTQHKKFKDKLSKILLKNVSGFPVSNILTKPEPKWEISESPVKNPIIDKVIAEIPVEKKEVEEMDQKQEEEEEEVKREDFKAKLNILLRSEKPNMYKTFPRNVVVKEVDDVNKGLEIIAETEVVAEKSEPRLSKHKTSISKTFPRTSVRKDEERDKHRERMANAFSSINSLRKPDDQ